MDFGLKWCPRYPATILWSNNTYLTLTVCHISSNTANFTLKTLKHFSIDHRFVNLYANTFTLDTTRAWNMYFNNVATHNFTISLLSAKIASSTMEDEMMVMSNERTTHTYKHTHARGGTPKCDPCVRDRHGTLALAIAAIRTGNCINICSKIQ